MISFSQLDSDDQKMVTMFVTTKVEAAPLEQIVDTRWQRDIYKQAVLSCL
jgi:hypothetical protein